MRRIRSRNTEPELLLRRALHARGARYRLHDRSVPGQPDVVFRRARVAVFVDGDFWHGHQWKLRGLARLEDQFSTNEQYWIRKINGNVERDRRVDQSLRQLGWVSLRIWESEVRATPRACAERVIAVVAGRLAGFGDT